MKALQNPTWSQQKMFSTVRMSLLFLLESAAFGLGVFLFYLCFFPFFSDVVCHCLPAGCGWIVCFISVTCFISHTCGWSWSKPLLTTSRTKIWCLTVRQLTVRGNAENCSGQTFLFLYFCKQHTVISSSACSACHAQLMLLEDLMFFVFVSDLTSFTRLLFLPVSVMWFSG